MVCEVPGLLPNIGNSMTPAWCSIILLVVHSCFLGQPMVNCWFGLAVWILEPPYERDCYLGVPVKSKATNPNQQLLFDWGHIQKTMASAHLLRPSRRNMGGLFSCHMAREETCYFYESGGWWWWWGGEWWHYTQARSRATGCTARTDIMLLCHACAPHIDISQLTCVETPACPTCLSQVRNEWGEVMKEGWVPRTYFDPETDLQFVWEGCTKGM